MSGILKAVKINISTIIWALFFPPNFWIPTYFKSEEFYIKAKILVYEHEHDIITYHHFT